MANSEAQKRYEVIDGNRHVMACNDCGAMVAYTQAHDEWHRRNDAVRITRHG